MFGVCKIIVTTVQDLGCRDSSHPCRGANAAREMNPGCRSAPPAANFLSRLRRAWSLDILERAGAETRGYVSGFQVRPQGDGDVET